MDGRKNFQRSLIAIPSFLLALPALYIAAHYAALVPEQGLFCEPWPDGSYLKSEPARYSVQGELVATMFYPAHFVESRYVREDSWIYEYPPSWR